jgi:hypothetical protein
LSRRSVDPVLTPFGAGLSVGLRGLGAVGSVVRAPSRLLARLAQALTALDDIARGVEAMHAEFVGMRADILVLDERVEGLRQEMHGFRTEVVPPVEDVSPMRASVDALEARVEGLTRQLESVDALAGRIGRIAVRRPKVRASTNRPGEPAPHEEEPTLDPSV